MNIKRQVLVYGFVLLAALMLLFPPRFWKIDGGVAWDITYSWAFAPAKYVGTCTNGGHSATSLGGTEWGLVALQVAALLLVAVIGWTLADDRRSIAKSPNPNMGNKPA